ncbi:MFS transporter [Azospirillum sp. ST 5-10]|uniref:MFS transporter n=1 Tax=unclassified Azospirillum TaxID=2630922 RepID=UPI003F49D9BC
MARRGRGGLWKVLLGSILILIVAQALNGGLSLASLNKIYFQSLVAGIKVAGSNAALKIEGAVRFGKPIEAFYGMQKVADDVRRALPELDDVVLALPDGQATYRAAGEARPIGRALGVARQAFAKGETFVMEEEGDDHLAIFAVRGKTGELAGMLALSFPDELVRERVRGALLDNLRLLGLSTGAAMAIMLGHFALLGGGRDRSRTLGARLYAVPIVAIVAAQAYYSFETVQTFRDEYVSVTRSNAERLTDLVRRDIESILGKGIKITSLVRIEDHFHRIVRSVPEIADIEIRDADRSLLHRIDQSGRVADPIAATASDANADADYQVVLPLRRAMPDGSRPLAGFIEIHLSPERIGEGVRQRMLDAGTLALLSALAVFELSILLTVLVRRTMGGHGADDPTTRHLLARPAVFSFLLAWALPLSFVPLQMRQLYEPIAGLPASIAMALPISLEMLCALFAALLAGALTDRRGWHVPFLAGVVVSIAGALLAGTVTSALAFVLCRGVVGLGYGLAWMGIQGFVFQHSTLHTRARGISNLVAGIFAGHICGTAIGAMLAEQVGFSFVFLVSAGAMLVPLVFAFAFMRPLMLPPEPGTLSVAGAAEAMGGNARRGLLAVLRDRNFLAVMLLSVIPFSIAQVGLLYYALPIYLAELQVNQSNIGRILMIYGLSVIYIAPLVARAVDRTRRKKPFIAAGGLVGGAGLAWLYVDHGMSAMILAVFLLGLASCLAGGAQSAFALRLQSVQAFGTGKAMGVQRAADKLGQMLGPLIVGALFTAVGMEVGLAVTGVLYLGATALFLIVASERSFRSRPTTETPPAGALPGAEPGAP